MERYLNRIPGQCRVQPEIEEHQIQPIITDLATIADPSPETRELLGVLEQARQAFGGVDG